ncbi:MAG: hypothetical protein ACP5D2_02785 [Candidatus Nanoarchaeia archaeon]
MEKVKSVLGSIGDFLSASFNKTFHKVGELSLGISDFQTKILTLIILFVLLYIILKFVNPTKKIIKFGLLLLVLIFILSIIFSL